MMGNPQALTNDEEGPSRRSMAYNKQLGKSKRNVEIDDSKGQSDNYVKVLIESVGDSAPLFLGSIVFALVWSVLCGFASEKLRELAVSDPGGLADRWVEDIKNGNNAISIVGTLFVFSVVFRVNACYARWGDSHIAWGDILAKSLELGMMSRSWIVDQDLADRMSRFIILFSYATKAILRGKSLSDDGEDGPALVKRGLLTQEELDDMNDNPCWQPHYCVHMIRLILVEAHLAPGGKALTFDHSNKLHTEMFRCFDRTLKKLGSLSGDCIRVRASGLPASYDAIVMLSYFSFFTIASVVWGVDMGWVAPIIIVSASVIIMFLIVIGTNLIDPFGCDEVDIPLDAFCETVELQIFAIDQRSRDGTFRRFARSSTPKTHGWTSNAKALRTSLASISTDLT